MTEKEFWLFLRDALAKGRVPQVSGCVDSNNPQIQKAGEYCGGHSVLFEGHDKLPVDTVIKMGGLLLNRSVTIPAKETILTILAHHPTREALNILKKYNKNPDEELKYTAHFALEECGCWNE